MWSLEERLRHMSITDHKPMPEGEFVRARRVEVFTGAGHRRSWTVEEKAAIVAESFASSSSVSQVARRQRLTPSQCSYGGAKLVFKARKPTSRVRASGR